MWYFWKGLVTNLCVRCRCRKLDLALCVCLCVCAHICMCLCVLCCGQGLWAPGSEMKDISHVAGLVELLSQHAATNQCFLPLS